MTCHELTTKKTGADGIDLVGNYDQLRHRLDIWNEPYLHQRSPFSADAARYSGGFIVCTDYVKALLA